MTTSVSFYFVDVFASPPLAGNPLALVPDADTLDESQMRAIAREFNQSETTFLLRPSLPNPAARHRDAPGVLGDVRNQADSPVPHLIRDTSSVLA
jgi:hypothetical protein